MCFAKMYKVYSYYQNLRNGVLKFIQNDFRKDSFTMPLIFPLNRQQSELFVKKSIMGWMAYSEIKSHLRQQIRALIGCD